MNVIIKIDGREAVPVRAIPYVTSWNESPDSIVLALAGKGLFPDRNLTAYQMDKQGNYEEVPLSQWEQFVVRFACSTKKFQADERAGYEGENWDSWRIGAALALPDNVFFWLDEFQHWYSVTQPLNVKTADENFKWEAMSQALHAKLHDTNCELSEAEWAMLDKPSPDFERMDDSLCLTPILPPEIEGKLWRYEAVPVLGDQKAPAPESAASVPEAKRFLRERLEAITRNKSISTEHDATYAELEKLHDQIKWKEAEIADALNLVAQEAELKRLHGELEGLNQEFEQLYLPIRAALGDPEAIATIGKTMSKVEAASIKSEEESASGNSSATVPESAIVEKPAPKKDGRITEKRESQIQAIERAAKELEHSDPLNLPTGARAEIKAHCIGWKEFKYSESGFKRAWQAAGKQSRIRLREKEKYM